MNDDEMGLNNFHKNGFAVIRNFYDYDAEILPILEGVSNIVRYVAETNKIYLENDGWSSDLTSNIMTLSQLNRHFASNVYDAVKQIPQFLSLVSSKKNLEIFDVVRPTTQAGIAALGYGIRIDFPEEEKFRTSWHQEFPAQLRSSRGLVFWTPLLRVTEALGPVEICAGSHLEGYRSVFEEKTSGKSGAYSLRLNDEDRLVGQFEKVAPLSEPGDLILLDYYTLHRSGRNKASHPRWSVQFRYFDFDDSFGRQINWRGSFAEGVDFQKALEKGRYLND